MAAIGGDDVVLFRMMFKKAGHVRTRSSFQSLENPDLIFAPFGFPVPFKRLVNVALEINANARADAILKVLHFAEVKPGVGPTGR